MYQQTVETFSQWRQQARQMIQAGVGPEEVIWSDDVAQPLLLGMADESPTGDCENARGEGSCGGSGVAESERPADAPTFSVPPAFLDAARRVACHRDSDRWNLLYRMLWRILHGERSLLEIETDNDVLRLQRMQKAVTRDVHKTKAFVRFRKWVDDQGEEVFVAWHRPDHRILRLAAPFFSRRYKEMVWSILTPDESVHWDQKTLRFGPGVPASQAPNGDELETLWKTYYASTFNPARIKVQMMKREMPVRHWATLPEAELISDLLRDAPARVSEMLARQEGFAETAVRYMPSGSEESISGQRGLDALQVAAIDCHACDLHHQATQTVFGHGAAEAEIVMVGEQPGDQEDVRGVPFVGPAGQLLRDCLSTLGVEQDKIYFTNTVKHFKHTLRGKKRIHQRPNAREISACRPWLEAELNLIRPRHLVLLGVTASQAVLGREFRLREGRGRPLRSEWCERTIATWHPSAILRVPDPLRREEMREQLRSDLRLLLPGDPGLS